MTTTLSQKHRDARDYPQGVAFMDGQYLPISEAKISVLDWGFLHSDATYDTVHVWNGAFFRLDLHLDRFFASMTALRMAIPLDRTEVAKVLHRCVALSGLRRSYVEMICTRGSSPTFSRDPRDATNRFVAFAVPYGSIATPEQMARGLHLAISNVVRIPGRSVDPSVKNYHWLDLVRGLYQAYDAEADTALLLDEDGNVAEGPGFNVFAAKDGGLTTPQKDVLPGITRRCVFDLCAEMDVPVAARALTPDALRRSDEVFITSTAGGIMPVSRIDGRPVGSGSVGPITRRLWQVYWDRHDYPLWCDPLEYPDAPGT